MAASLGGPAGASDAEPRRDERMIVASDEMVITFDGSSVKVRDTMRTARVNLYMAKRDEHGAIRYGIDVEADCRRNMQREMASVGTRSDGSSLTLPVEPGDHDFKPVPHESFGRVIQEHLCGIKDEKVWKGGVYLYAPGDMAARSVFALLALGLENEPAAQLSSYIYTDPDMLKTTLDAQKVAPERRAAVVKALDAQIAPEAKPPPPIIPLASAVATGHVGKYVHSEMELVAGLWLKADGTFQYWLTVGSLDETAKGRWTASGSRIQLVNDHPVKPPTITPGPAAKDASTKLHLKIVTPSGRGVPGVDLTVGLADSKTEEGYTQADGWTLPAGQTGKPRWVSFSMDSYRLQSPRFPIDLGAANMLTYLLTPNDIGVVDASTMTVTASRDGLTVIREGHLMQFGRRGQ